MYKTVAETVRFFDEFKPLVRTALHCEIVVCPTFPALAAAVETARGSNIQVGAQNLHWEDEGAFTGEISGPMIRAAGCTHVIIGHSERRQIFGETGPRLARKVRAVVGHELTCIYCVGETIEQRDAGRTEDVVERQVREVLGADVPAERLVVAYEPVWAIGTGRTATPEQAQEVHAFLRGQLGSIYGGEAGGAIRILYGGSVKPSNAAGLLEQPDIDGALVGGACLVAEDFLAIISSAVKTMSR
jgi:triosephosphate isomerase